MFDWDWLDWLVWHLWTKPVYRWRHRNDTLQQAREEILHQWDNTLAEFADEPAGRELHDAITAMDEVKKSFGV